jgi:leucyl aminopeptidase
MVNLPAMTELKLIKQQDKTDYQTRIILLDNINDIEKLSELAESAAFIKLQVKNKEKSIPVYNYKSGTTTWLITPPDENVQKIRSDEDLRQTASDLFRKIQKSAPEELVIYTSSGTGKNLLSVLEGFMLSSYKFDKYKTEIGQPEKEIGTIKIPENEVKEKDLKDLSNVIKAVFRARTLVNEPLSYLTAQKFSEEIENLGREAGFIVEVFQKSRIEALKMGGLLGVNKGSPNPPTFNILDYNPTGAVNKKPYVLVGKGVVYDTGGISLKPSEGMEAMKCDMAGAAAVAGTIYAAAANKLPVHIIGLIPATENRPSGDAIVPGDILTISNGKTVEVINTDAEGRLILADALCYAKKFNPELVIDLATLTGSAIRAIGKEGMVMMGTAGAEVKSQLTETGFEVYERIVEFPLWEEYGKYLESDIADIKNLGPSEAGAITAGKFLEFFTSFPWIHLDIAGGAFLSSEDSYRGKNGTGIGVRLIYNFLKKQAE